MNYKLIDGWSIAHLIFSIIITLIFIRMNISIIILTLLIFLFEILEHSIMGDLIFDWFEKKRKEVIINSIIDIVLGLIGVIIGYNIYY